MRQIEESEFPQSSMEKNEDSKERNSEIDPVKILRSLAEGRVLPGESWCDGKNSLNTTYFQQLYCEA